MKRITQVNNYALSSYLRQTRGIVDDNAAELFKNEDFKKGYFAFTCLLYNPTDGLLYCGNTNFGNNILHSFNPETHEFKSLKYQEFGEKFEIKVHRALELGNDGKIYGATSCLHGVENRLQGSGGKIFSYDPESGKYECLCIPVPHDYIQTISLDPTRGMIYGFSYPVFEFFAYSLSQKEVVYRQFMDSISHISAIDDAGGYWGTWSCSHKLFRYDPDENVVKFFNHGFPERGGNMMYRNAGPIDCMINGLDGFLYVATDLGSLYRLDPESGEVEFLGKPFSSSRLPGLVLGNDGLLYLSGGDDNDCRIAVYDRNTRRFDTLGKVVADDGTKCFRTHDIKIIGSRIFVAETDNPKRSDYLWECITGC